MAGPVVGCLDDRDCSIQQRSNGADRSLGGRGDYIVSVELGHSAWAVLVLLRIFDRRLKIFDAQEERVAVVRA